MPRSASARRRMGFTLSGTSWYVPLVAGSCRMAACGKRVSAASSVGDFGEARVRSIEFRLFFATLHEKPLDDKRGTAGTAGTCRLFLGAHELVALQGSGNVVGGLAGVRPVSAQHLANTAQTNPLVRWSAEGDDVFDGRPDVRFPPGSEQY